MTTGLLPTPVPVVNLVSPSTPESFISRVPLGIATFCFKMAVFAFHWFMCLSFLTKASEASHRPKSSLKHLKKENDMRQKSRRTVFEFR